MGRLAGLRANEVLRKLRRAGFVFDRQGHGSHEIWRHPETGRKTTVAHHPGEMREGTVAAIVKEAGLTVDEFLDL